MAQKQARNLSQGNVIVFRSKRYRVEEIKYGKKEGKQVVAAKLRQQAKGLQVRAQWAYFAPTETVEVE